MTVWNAFKKRDNVKETLQRAKKGNQDGLELEKSLER